MKKLKFYTLLISLIVLAVFLTIQPTCTPIKEIVVEQTDSIPETIYVIGSDSTGHTYATASQIKHGTTGDSNIFMGYSSGYNNTAIGYSALQSTTTGTYSGPFGDTIYLTMLGFANYCLELDIYEPTRAHIEKYYKQGGWEYYRKHIIK